MAQIGSYSPYNLYTCTPYNPFGWYSTWYGLMGSYYNYKPVNSFMPFMIHMFSWSYKPCPTWESSNVGSKCGTVTDPSAKIVKATYAYDANGNVVSAYERGVAVGEVTENKTYKYDALGRLTEAHDFGKSNNYYTYDSLGNLTYETSDGGKNTDYKLNKLNQITAKTVNGVEKYSYTYDKRGNETKQTNDNTGATEALYEYDETNKMVKGRNVNGEISEYIYNGLGILIENKGEVTKDFVIDYTSSIQNVLMEYETGSGGNLSYRYVYGLDKVSVNITPVNGAEMRLYYDEDRMGSSQYLYGKNGKIESWADYSEWGNVTKFQPLKVGSRDVDIIREYTNHDYDAVLDLYYAKARFYDSQDKRFVAVYIVKGSVRVPMSLVQYLYVFDNPLKFVDWLGLFKQDTKLYQNAGSKKLDTQDSKDILSLQIRLMTLGYIVPENNIQYGVLDETTMNAVVKYKYANGLAIPPDPKYGLQFAEDPKIVNAKLWSSLELNFEATGPMFSEDISNDSDYLAGKALAKLVLDKHVFFDLHSSILDGKNMIEWQYSSFSLGAKYYNKLQCAIGKSNINNAASTIADFIDTCYNSYEQAKEISGGYPLALIAATAYGISVEVVAKICGMESEPSGSVYEFIKKIWDEQVGTKLEKNIETASNNFDIIKNSSLKYVLEEKQYSSYVTPKFLNDYYKSLANVALSIRNLDNDYLKTALQIDDSNVTKIKKSAINFIEDIIRFQIDKKQRQEFINFYIK